MSELTRKEKLKKFVRSGWLSTILLVVFGITVCVGILLYATSLDDLSQIVYRRRGIG